MQKSSTGSGWELLKSFSRAFEGGVEMIRRVSRNYRLFTSPPIQKIVRSSSNSKLPNPPAISHFTIDYLSSFEKKDNI
jgi:hypothetical protein